MFSKELVVMMLESRAEKLSKNPDNNKLLAKVKRRIKKLK